jgi:hypothetical protein
MAWIGRGKVRGGGIVFPTPLPLPEGTEVVVRIEPAAREGQQATPGEKQGFASLPFFGMYAGRQDMQDSAAWVREERERWHQRAARPD